MKKMFLQASLLVCLTCFFLFSGFAQEKMACGTMYADSLLRTNNPARGTLTDFENWLQEKISEREQYGTAKMQQVYTLPVVVHVIHAGEAVGVGRNISDAQINSQLIVLNSDFRKTNADISNVPGIWTSVAADCEINFCMAEKDPTGLVLPVPGVDRINVTAIGYGPPPYSIAEFENIKSGTIWDPNKYLNIWVGHLSDPGVGGTLLGYATLPPNSGLTGIPNGLTGSEFDDGVAILYTAFGTTGNVSFPYNRGRTTVHEIGHWLGLRHTWGDDSGECTGSDYCNDTPNQANASSGNPSFPRIDVCSQTSPGIMYMNHMDYSSDGSRIMFTMDQKTRMQTVMANSSMRNNLAQQANCIGTSIEKQQVSNNVSVYPNPANNTLFIDLPAVAKMNSTVEIKLFGMLGNLVSAEETTYSGSDISVDVSAFSDGIYFVQITNEKETHLEKIIISR